MCHQLSSIHQLIGSPNTYTAEDCLAWPQREKVHLTYFRDLRPQGVKRSSGMEVGDENILLEMGEEVWDEELSEDRPRGG